MASLISKFSIRHMQTVSLAIVMMFSSCVTSQIESSPWKRTIAAELAREKTQAHPVSTIPLSFSGGTTSYYVPVAVGQWFGKVPNEELVSFLKSLRSDQNSNAIVDSWLATLRIAKKYPVSYRTYWEYSSGAKEEVLVFNAPLFEELKESKPTAR